MKKLESGRSMVEMLGVLAIIGVLSIGGIAGYTLSMRRYRANQVLDAANKYSLIAYGACQQEIITGTLLTDITNCVASHVPAYTDANLGTVADASAMAFGGIAQASGVDTVTINVTFKDNQVCKAAKSIMGSKSSKDCVDGTSGKLLAVKIKQN